METHLREKIINTRDGNGFGKNASVFFVVVIQYVGQQNGLRGTIS